MNDIVKRLRGFDTLKFDAWALCDEAADLIERQREALRVARETLSERRIALSIERKKLGEDYGFSCMGVFYCNSEAKEIDAAIAAIDAALKEDGE